MWKVVCFTPTMNNTKIRKTISFAIVPKIIKYLGINLNMEVKDFYTVSYKILLKETKDLNKQKDISRSWIETPKEQATKDKINSTASKVTSVHQRILSRKEKHDSLNGIKYLQIIYLARDWNSEYIKNTYNSIKKKQLKNGKWT